MVFVSPADDLSRARGGLSHARGGLSRARDGGDAPASAFFVTIPVAADAVTPDIAAIRVGLAQAARTVNDAGMAVRFVNGMYLPAEACLLCAFTADRRETVRAALRLIDRPYTFVEMRSGRTGPLPSFMAR